MNMNLELITQNHIVYSVQDLLYTFPALALYPNGNFLTKLGISEESLSVGVPILSGHCTLREADSEHSEPVTPWEITCLIRHLVGIYGTPFTVSVVRDFGKRIQILYLVNLEHAKLQASWLELHVNEHRLLVNQAVDLALEEIDDIKRSQCS